VNPEKRMYRNITHKRLSSIFIGDPVDGFPIAKEKRKIPSEIYMPSNFYEKDIINEDEIIQLKEILGTAKTFKEITNSQLFAGEYIKIKVNW
jgi:hypothetical protein